jgi:hypothetical protein
LCPLLRFMSKKMFFLPLKQDSLVFRSGQKLLSELAFEKKVREYNDYGNKRSGSSKLELTSRLVRMSH